MKNHQHQAAETAPLPSTSRQDFMSLSQSDPFLYRARVWLLSGIFFALPMRVSYVYILSALLLIVWIAEGRWGEKLKQITQSKLCIAFIGYYLVFVLGMLWTDNVSAGWQMVDRQTPFLLFLLYWSCAEPKYRERYIGAFIAGVTVCALLAHYNWMQAAWFPDWPRGIRVSKSPGDTAPFVDWIMYAPILALGAYFSMRRIFVLKEPGSRIAAIVITSLLISNLAFSGGRAGMLMFAALLSALIFERVKAGIKALLLCAVLLPVMFISAYGLSDHFAERVSSGISDIRNFAEQPSTSLGQRFVFWTTSLHIIADNPLLGVGSGDFAEEYPRAKPARWQMTPDTFNPHNQFLMTGATTGLLGLALLLSIFYYAARSGVDARMSAVLIGFAAICFFESYLWRSNTALTFSVILAALVLKNKQTLVT